MYLEVFRKTMFSPRLISHAFLIRLDSNDRLTVRIDRAQVFPRMKRESALRLMQQHQSNLCPLTGKQSASESSWQFVRITETTHSSYNDVWHPYDDSKETWTNYDYCYVCSDCGLEASQTYEQRQPDIPPLSHPSQVRVTADIGFDEGLGEFCYSTEPARLAMVLGNVRDAGPHYAKRYFPDFAQIFEGTAATNNPNAHGQQYVVLKG
jgi:hypothetical protein